MYELKLTATKNNIKQEYLADNRPFVVTYSGGKDSTLLLHLYLDVLMELKHLNIPLKQSFIVSSNTKVELPIIENFLSQNLIELKIFCEENLLNTTVTLLEPEVKNSFFALMIGKGYPPPNRNFRWCTDRLKIKPVETYFKTLTDQYSSIIMLIGVRRDESENRKRSIDSRQSNYRGLNLHDSMANTYVFAPISDWTTEEVWAFLRKNKPYWRNSYIELLNLYAKGSGDSECNLTMSQNQQSCGNSRFGCWTCTVVAQDKSMEGMLKSGEDYLSSLNEFRNYLVEIREDSNKRNARRKNGEKGLGDFLMEVRFELLEKLFQVEQESNLTLISDAEIQQIQFFWNLDGNIDNRALKIANKYRNNKFVLKENINFDSSEYECNHELMLRIIDIEQLAKITGNRRQVLSYIEQRIENHFKRSFSENYKN